MKEYKIVTFQDWLSQKRLLKKTSDYINKEAEENWVTVSVNVDANSGKSIITLSRDKQKSKNK